MDNEEFKRRLSEVAEWRIPETITGTKDGSAKKRRGRKSDEDIYQETREQIFLEEFGGVNNTFPPQLLSIKCQPTTCEDCGAHCPNGRQKEKKLYETGTKKKRNWRERCLTCNKNYNPFTGKFDLTPQEASFVWTNFLRDSKGAYQTAGNKAREELANKTNMPNSVETEDGIITFYPDSKRDA